MNRKPEQLTQIYKLVGYELGIIGNVEFNYGLDYLRVALATLYYPTLKLYMSKAGVPAFGEPYKIFERCGM